MKLYRHTIPIIISLILTIFMSLDQSGLWFLIYIPIVFTIATCMLLIIARLYKELIYILIFGILLRISDYTGSYIFDMRDIDAPISFYIYFIDNLAMFLPTIVCVSLMYQSFTKLLAEKELRVSLKK